MNEQDIQFNRQLYLIEQKIEQIQEVLDQIYNVFYFAADKNGNDLSHPTQLKHLESQVQQLKEIPDA
jgi:signal transduction histidine kinase